MLLQRIFPKDTSFNRVAVVVCKSHILGLAAQPLTSHPVTVLTILQGVMDYINLYRNTVTYYGVFAKYDEQDCEC